jgi:phospholipid transport system substrate-binding protein
MRLLTRIEEGQPMGVISHNTGSQCFLDFEQRNGVSWSWTVITGVVVLLALTGTGATAAELTPTEAVKSTITEVMQILDNAELNQPGRAAERRQRMEQVVKHRVSYEDMATRALGVPWMELTDSERQEFVGLFVQLLRGTFTGRIDDYTGEQVLYQSEQREAQFADVKTKLAGPKTDTFLDFRLANRLGKWLVYDMVIIRDLSYAGLVKRMKEKILIVKAIGTTTAP